MNNNKDHFENKKLKFIEAFQGNKPKIKSLDKIALNLYKKYKNKTDIVMISCDWKATYSIETLIKSRTSEYSKGYKTNKKCDLLVGNAFLQKYTQQSDEHHTFQVGDIANDFLKIFSLQGDIDFDYLNKFIVKYKYPPISYECETAIPKKSHIIAVNNNGIQYDAGTCGFEKETSIYYPIEKDIEKYVISIQSFYTKYFNFFSDSALCNFTANVFFNSIHGKHKTTIISDSLNSLVLYDAVQAYQHYKIKKCPICNKMFFANRSNNQKKCLDCKQITRMSDKELKEKKIKSEKLSNNVKRNSYIRYLNRKYPLETFIFKNEMLRKKGFAPLYNKGE